MLTPDEAVVLETLVDKHGLQAVVDELSSICNEKADHVRVNYQDTPLAKEWEQDADTLHSISINNIVD